MKIRIVFIFIIVFNFILSEERSWNTTPFDRLWNKTVHPMMFRDPIIITPFDIRIGQTYWGGEDYWNSFSHINYWPDYWSIIRYLCCPQSA